MVDSYAALFSCTAVVQFSDSMIWYYKFKEIIGNPNFPDLFKCIVNRIIKAGHNMDIMRQTACLVFNPIMVESYAKLFSCTAVVQASDSMTA